MSAHTGRVRRAVGRALVDTGPLRRHPGFRRLWTGQLIASLGSQLTVVAVGYQTYRLTNSTAMVGLVSLGQLVPLLAGSLVGGPFVDAWDRRRVMMATQVLLAAGCHGAGRQRDAGASAAVADVRLHRGGRRLPGGGLGGPARVGAAPGARDRSRRRAVPPVRRVPADAGGRPGRSRAAHRACRVRAGVRAERGGVLHRVLVRGAAAAAAAGRRRAAGRGRLADRRRALPADQPAAGGRLHDRPRRDGVRHAAGAVSRARGDPVRRGRGHGGVPQRRGGPRCAGRVGAHRPRVAGAAAGPVGGGLRRACGAWPSPGSGSCPGCPPRWRCWWWPVPPTWCPRCSGR